MSAVSNWYLFETMANTGGTAGCVLAARLTEKEPSVSVLILEAGEGNVLKLALLPDIPFYKSIASFNEDLLIAQTWTRRGGPRCHSSLRRHSTPNTNGA